MTIAGMATIWRANQFFAPEMYHAVGPRKMAAALKELAEKGFIKVNKSRPKSDGAGAAPQAAGDGKVEAFQPRIRAVGLD